MVRDACPTRRWGLQTMQSPRVHSQERASPYPGCAPRGAASRRMNAKQFSCYGQSAISWPSLPGAARTRARCSAAHQIQAALEISGSTCSGSALSRAKGFDLACVADRATSRHGRTIDNDARNYTQLTSSFVPSLLSEEKVLPKNGGSMTCSSQRAQSCGGIGVLVPVLRYANLARREVLFAADEVRAAKQGGFVSSQCRRRR
jgi:hypothetical protein